MIVIVKACIFSPSLTRQLHYHSQLDKSVAWFWKSNEDNLLWILWMRTQFTWQWPPALTEVEGFTSFAAWEASPCAEISKNGDLFRSRKQLDSANQQFRPNKLGSGVPWQVSGRSWGDSSDVVALCRWWVNADARPEPGSSCVQALPRGSDFTTCQRTLSHSDSHSVRLVIQLYCDYICGRWGWKPREQIQMVSI